VTDLIVRGREANKNKNLRRRRSANNRKNVA